MHVVNIVALTDSSEGRDDCLTNRQSCNACGSQLLQSLGTACPTLSLHPDHESSQQLKTREIVEKLFESVRTLVCMRIS